jgi:nitrate reductase beta subunit
VRYPYIRGVLLELYREALARLGDPVLAWADIQNDPQRRRRYQQARGKGGLVRASWDEAVTAAVGMEPAEIEAMYRLPAIAKYEDRYVIPTAAVGDARRLEESALPDGCSLDHDGGPGMGGYGPFGQDSGRRHLPLVSVETFHALRRRRTTDEAKET